MINGQEYAWEDVQIVVQGKSIPLTGVKDIKYTTKKVHVNLPGRGNEPVAMGRGQKTYESGEITLYLSEVLAMEAAMPKGKSLVDRGAFSITHAYAPEEGPGVVYNLVGCRFEEDPRAIGTEDTHQEVTLKFLPFRIELAK